MRNRLKSVEELPAHLGLAYDAWAPTGADGKVPDREREAWLTRLAVLPISADYVRAFERWKTAFKLPGDRLFELELLSRLLLGHGNPSATDVGITLQRTWGVPLIPGSALKGLLAHYVDAVYGPDKPELPPGEQPEDQRERVGYQGVIRQRGRVIRGPGELYGKLFGAPEADQGPDAGASAGCVVFHDAVYVPGSAVDDCPFAPDVLTVHQKMGYYDSCGGSWPNDYENPNPVPFLTVRPGVRILAALSGPAEWTGLAEQLLVDALRVWGVGGKTSSGYGRLVRADEAPGRNGRAAGHNSAQAEEPRHRRGDRIKVERVPDSGPKAKIKFRTPDGFLGHFVGENPPPIGTGGTIEVWVANVSPHAYTLTLRHPKDKKR